MVALADLNQPYSCTQWGNVPNGGATQIISDTGYDIWELFESQSAFPSTVFINHEMQVYDKMNNAGSWSISSRITDMLEECGSDCDPDPCSGVSEGDVYYDSIINIVDVIFVVQHILGNIISDECEPDVNQDGSIDVNDVILLVNFVLN